MRLLLAAAMPMIRERGLTLLGISVGNFDGDGWSSWSSPFDGQPGVGLDVALDEVRAKFGTTAFTRAVLLGRTRDWRCRCCRTDGTAGLTGAGRLSTARDPNTYTLSPTDSVAKNVADAPTRTDGCIRATAAKGCPDERRCRR